MQNGDGAETNVLSHDNRARPFVDHNACPPVHYDRQIFNFRHHRGQAGNADAGGIDFDASAVAGDGDLVSEGEVDGVGNFAGSSEVRLAQEKVERHQAIEVQG